MLPQGNCKQIHGVQTTISFATLHARQLTGFKPTIVHITRSIYWLSIECFVLTRNLWVSTLLHWTLSYGVFNGLRTDMEFPGQYSTNPQFSSDLFSYKFCTNYVNKTVGFLMTSYTLCLYILLNKFTMNLEFIVKPVTCVLGRLALYCNDPFNWNNESVINHGKNSNHENPVNISGKALKYFRA